MRVPKKQSVKESFADSKFYLLVFWLCVTLVIVCFLRITSVSNRLYYSSLEQFSAWLAVVNGFFLLAFYFLPNVSKKSVLVNYLTKNSAALGWSTLWFASWHALLVFIGQLGGWQGFWTLSFKYWLAFGFGLLSLAFLAQTLLAKRLKKQLAVAVLTVLVGICLIGMALAPTTKKQPAPAEVSGGSIHGH